MGILERSKVKLSIQLDNETLQPGEDVTGTVQMDVKELISFCALRLHIRGRETVEVLVQRGTATMAVTGETDYANNWLTFTGPCKRSQRREKQTYEPGSYSYPFRVALSPCLPPSFAVTTNSGTAALFYTASAVLDIPNGFDATDEARFRVLSVSPLHQFNVRAAHAAALPVTRVANMFNHSWLCCLWGKRDDAATHVSVSITPGIVALTPTSDDAAEEPARPATTCDVTLKLFNDSDSALPALHLELLNIVRLQYDMHESFHTSLVAKASLDHLSLAAQEERTVTVPLTLNFSDFRTRANDPTNLPIPSLGTTAVTSAYALKVAFPDSKVEKLSFMGIVDFVDAVSVIAGTMGVPTHYLPPVGLGTEVRYVAQPTMIAFPSEDDLIYPAVHEPYLPRTAAAGDADTDAACEVSETAGTSLGGNSISAANGESAHCLVALSGVFEGSEDGKKEHQREGIATGSVLAVPLPRQMIVGSVSEIANPQSSRER